MFLHESFIAPVTLLLQVLLVCLNFDTVFPLRDSYLVFCPGSPLLFTPSIAVTHISIEPRELGESWLVFSTPNFVSCRLHRVKKPCNTRPKVLPFFYGFAMSVLFACSHLLFLLFVPFYFAPLWKKPKLILNTSRPPFLPSEMPSNKFAFSVRLKEQVSFP